MEFRSFRVGTGIRFVSSSCSTGKTWAACKYFSRQQRTTNCLYVAPSLELLNETSKELQKIGLEHEVISSETHPNHVRQEIIQFLKSTMDHGHVLLITWNAYINLPYFDRRSNWDIVIDEVPQVDQFYRLMLPLNCEFVTEHLQTFPTHYPNLSLVKAANRGKLERLINGPRDDVHEIFRPLFRDVLSDSKFVYVDNASWSRVAEEHEISKRHEENTIFFLSMLRPRPQHEIVLLGANLQDSILYHWFSHHGAWFVEEEGITSGLREPPESLGERARISYFIPGRNHSKSLCAKEIDGAQTLGDKMDELALKEFGDQPALYIPNNGRKSVLLDHAPNMRKVPVVSNGLNSLQDYHKIYISAALNREPKHFAMLKSLGLSSEVVHKASAHETCYQGVMRTSLRNPESTEKVHAIVADEPTARRLAELLGCHEVHQIGGLLPPPRTPLSQTDRRRRSELHRFKSTIFAPKEQQRSFINQDCSVSGAKFTEPPNLKIDVTFHKHPFAKNADEFVAKPYGLHDFIGELRKTAKTQIDSKDELFLWNPATFDPKGGEGYRRQEYVIQSSCLVLDFDDGTLSPEEFEDIFWHKAGRGEKHSFVIHSSFSRSEKHPNKFRVILFYHQPAQSLEEHKAAYRYVVRRLEAWGHTEQSAQLDTNCESGNQSFWVPSTNRAQEEFAFFREFGTKTRDLVRCAIDPSACPREVKVPEIPPANAPSEPTIRKEYLEKAAVIAAELAAMTSGRNHTFFMFGFWLAKGGLPKYEIESRLNECAGSETKMRKKVPGILKNLEKYGVIEWC